MSEDHLIQYCAPTLAGIKTGSLFGCSCGSRQELHRTLGELNRRLVPRGLRVLPLRCSENRALIYLYRPSALRQDLSHSTASRLLEASGYRSGTCESIVAQLSRRIRTCEEFPHEIGLFLGYPPEDVAGFIENKAGNCKCVGCWKVYGDVDAAQKKFRLYRKCSRVYQKCWETGCTLEKLTVRARA